MKGKIVLFIIIGIFLLGLVGWVSYSKFKGNKTVSTGSNSEKSGIFTSVKDALTQKLTLSCEFTDETGTVVKSYIKNGAVRVSSIGNGDNVQANEIIIKDKKEINKGDSISYNNVLVGCSNLTIFCLVGIYLYNS